MKQIKEFLKEAKIKQSTHISSATHTVGILLNKEDTDPHCTVWAARELCKALEGIRVENYSRLSYQDYHLLSSDSEIMNLFSAIAEL